eukprot:SAG31_NODE_10906_length_1085_cov_1.185598_1_plen_133_part_00
MLTLRRLAQANGDAPASLPPTCLSELTEAAEDAGIPPRMIEADQTPAELQAQIEKHLECRLVIALEDTDWGDNDLLHTPVACSWAHQVVAQVASEFANLRLGVAAQLAEKCWQVRDNHAEQRCDTVVYISTL